MVDNWARDTVMWYYSVGTLFWQLSTELTSQKRWDFALVYLVGRTDVRSRDYQNFSDGEIAKFS